jgi:hypothetical protein
LQCALGGMPLNSQPSSDGVLFSFLSAAVAAMIGFGALVTWLARPTVLPNVPYTYSDTQKRAPIISRIADSPDNVDPEQAAVAYALGENQRLGLDTPVVGSVSPAPALAAKSNQVAKATPPKTKRVARVQREPRVPRNSWAYNPQGAVFGGFFR